MLTVKSNLCFLVVLFCCLCASAQQKEVTGLISAKYDVKSGLPARYIRKMLCDSRGQLWIGTPQGLARYDGRTVKTYKTPSDTVFEEDIIAITEDLHGNIIICSHENG